MTTDINIETKDVVLDAVAWLPIVGDLVNFVQFLDEINKKNYRKAAIHFINALPIPIQLPANILSKIKVSYER
jgi:hypothetical protein